MVSMNNVYIISCIDAQTGNVTLRPALARQLARPPLEHAETLPIYPVNAKQRAQIQALHQAFRLYINALRQKRNLT